MACPYDEVDRARLPAAVSAGAILFEQNHEARVATRDWNMRCTSEHQQSSTIQ
jgi:hypothetical protein